MMHMRRMGSTQIARVVVHSPFFYLSLSLVTQEILSIVTVLKFLLLHPLLVIALLYCYSRYTAVWTYSNYADQSEASVYHLELSKRFPFLDCTFLPGKLLLIEGCFTYLKQKTKSNQSIMLYTSATSRLSRIEIESELLVAFI